MAEQIEQTKHPAAVALGQLGGLKGGKVRCDTVSDAVPRFGNLF